MEEVAYGRSFLGALISGGRALIVHIVTRHHHN